LEVSQFKKLNLATKAQKKNARHFFSSCLCILVATFFRSKAAKKILRIVIVKELKKLLWGASG